MKIILILALSTLLIACGKGDQVDLDSKSVSLQENLVANCSVVRDEELKHVVISCPDGTEVTIIDGVNGIDGIDGSNGSNGQNGTNGEDGTSCVIAAMTGGSMITCGATSAFIKNGEDGEDGSACSVTTASDNSGALIECSDGSVAYIKNGQNGEDGNDGEDGSDGQNGNDGLDFVQEVIDPCGTETTHGLDEVIFKLASGDFLAHFAQGKKQYLTILNKNQNYVTTDGTGCKFKINDDNDLVLR